MLDRKCVKWQPGAGWPMIALLMLAACSADVPVPKVTSLASAITSPADCPIRVRDLALRRREAGACLIGEDHVLRCWGEAVPQPTPISDPNGALGRPMQVAFSHYHGCAVALDGHVACWGEGLLGDGVTTQSAAPVRVIGITDARSVGVGFGFSCALRASGTVSCWGTNPATLGDGATTQTHTPVQVAGVTSAIALGVGRTFACALEGSGQVKCWGEGGHGSIGDGGDPAEDAPTPRAVAGLADAVALAVGENHACAVRADRSIACWGNNSGSQLGRPGVGLHSSSPVTVLDPDEALSGPTAIAAGVQHTCALGQDGGVACWGNNFDGQLGDGTHINANTPVRAIGLPRVHSIAAGGNTSCAIGMNDTVSCWGQRIPGREEAGDATPRPPIAASTDLNSDTANCGACGNVCADGEVCSGGVCGCPENLSSCILRRDPPLVGFSNVDGKYQFRVHRSFDLRASAPLPRLEGARGVSDRC